MAYYLIINTFFVNYCFDGFTTNSYFTTLYGAVIVYAPCVHFWDIEIKQILYATNIASTDDVFGNIMPSFADTLGYALNGQFWRIQPEKQQRHTVTFVMGSMNKIDIGSGGKSGLNGE